jgi:peptidoglycan/LPS O-acetylase OafA/YrhL
MSQHSAPITAQSYAPSSGNQRMVFLDLLRVAIIVMVIVHHAAQAYGPTGGTWPITDRATSDWFGPFYTVNAAVGLGLLFLLAGYFVPRAYDRKGPRRFLKERWLRLGIPLVIFSLLIHLPIAYLLAPAEPATFFRALYEDGWQGTYFHLWFLGHLLLYSAVYVGWRRLADRLRRPLRAFAPPGHLAISGFVVALALVTWIVHRWYVVDEWVPLLFVVPVEPAHLPQYVSLFAIGVLAYRGDWFRRIPTRVGATWLGLGLAAAVAVYVLAAFDVWNDLLATGLEALIAGGLSVGLVVVARQIFDRPKPLIAKMATASYAAYILHLYIIVGLQAAILALEMTAAVKFALVAMIGIALSFGVAHLSGKVPGLRVVLGTTPRGTALPVRIPMG